MASRGLPAAESETVRGLSIALCQTASGAPRAPPASPAAGWIQRSSKIPARSSTPLATQLSATPPAMQRLRLPVISRAWRASLRTISSVTSWIDFARSISRWVIGDSGGRAGPPNSAANLPLVISRPSR